MLKELGGTIKYDDMINVHPLNNFLNPFNITIPGDPSSAAFFAAAAANFFAEVEERPAEINFFMLALANGNVIYYVQI